MVRGTIGLSRKEDKIYWANLCGLIPYLVIAALTVKFRVDKIDTKGRCIIGMQRQTAIFIISYDFVINVGPPSVVLMLGVSYNSVSSPYLGIVFLFSSA